MDETQTMNIDLENLIKSKNPKLLKWMPGFLIRYLKRIIHQDDVNSFISRNKDKKNQEFCAAVVDEFDLHLSIDHRDRIPKSGPVTIVMNHPLGGMDAISFVHLLADYRQDIRFIVNDLLMNLDGLKDMFKGVNKHGTNSLSSRREIAKLFETDQMICVFPAGLVSRKQKGKIRDTEWKKTFLTTSREHNRVIVPVHIEGRLTNFFYNLANLRKFFGIKANIEMLYLVNELYKQKGKTIHFSVGKPFDINEFDHSKKDSEWAEWVKNIVYQLPDGND